MKSNQRHQNTDRPVQQGKKSCKLVRRRLFGHSAKGDSGFLGGMICRSGIDLETPWVQRHIAACPRCQRRFSALNRVNLALALMKSQAHDKDLLGQANSGTIAVLQRDLRETSKAQTLREALPNMTIRDRIRLSHHAISHVAACIALLLLSKTGVFSTIKHSQAAGQKAVRQLYTSHLDADTADEVFPLT